MLPEKWFGVPCRACGRRARLRTLGDVAPTLPGPFHVDSFSLVHCPRCDVVYLDPLPTPEDLHRLYQESTQFDDPHYEDPHRIEQVIDYLTQAIRRLDLLPRTGGRLLEVGAGLAWMSRVCKRVRPEVTTVAQDVSTEAAERCPWVDRYHVGPIATLVDPEPFHLASMTHVIEHLADPSAMLGEIAARLVPGGKLFVTAPYRPTGWRLRHGIDGWRDYSYLHVPAHITYFSRAWFERAARPHRLRVVQWNANHEDGQAFELVLVRY